tara:strand:+ start:1218 stop:1610 length:393 start_codon:yes stop_codon:yes gene_type:complete
MRTSKEKIAFTFLMFSALTEILLDMYSLTTMFKTFDSSLHNKLVNLKVNFERVSKQSHSMFNEGEIKSFYHMVNIFEELIKKAGESDFADLLEMIDKWNKGELTFIDTPEELIKIANENQTFSTSNHEDT